jgi:hypothetical protein
MSLPSPPGCHLVAGDRRIPGTIGSTVWAGMAVDRVLEPLSEAAVVNRGQEVRFQGEDDDAPDEAFLWAYREGDLPHPDRAAWEGPLDPQELRWTADLEPGSYLLAVFRRWAGRGDVTYHFGLRIGEP